MKNKLNPTRGMLFHVLPPLTAAVVRRCRCCRAHGTSKAHKSPATPARGRFPRRSASLPASLASITQHTTAQRHPKPKGRAEPNPHNRRPRSDKKLQYTVIQYDLLVFSLAHAKGKRNQCASSGNPFPHLMDFHPQTVLEATILLIADALSVPSTSCGIYIYIYICRQHCQAH